MNVLIVLPTATIGGAERVSFYLAFSLLRTGHTVTIYIMSKGHQVGWESVVSQPRCKFISKKFASEKSSLFSFSKDVYNLSKDNEFDFVFSTHTHVNAALSFFRRIHILRCKKLISRESTFIFERFFGVKRYLFFMLYRFFYGEQDCLVFQTKGMEKSLKNALGSLPVAYSVVLQNPISRDYVRTQLEGSRVVKSRKICIIACGRLIPIKGFDLLIKAYSVVRHYYPQSVLQIVGNGPDLPALKLLVEKLELEDHVIFLGRVANPFPFYSNADLGLVSSRQEGFPNVLIEMMACGIGALVTTPCTDGVFSLPGIEITDDFSYQSISNSIIKVLGERWNRSPEYLSYVESSCSVEDYIDGFLRAGKDNNPIF
jgi:glycosyltransferase involved in cell wall biosynthesis